MNPEQLDELERLEREDPRRNNGDAYLAFLLAHAPKLIAAARENIGLRADLALTHADTVRRALAKLQRDNDQLRAENDKLRELLRRVEWCHPEQERIHQTCHLCDGFGDTGHELDCELAEALGK